MELSGDKIARLLAIVAAKTIKRQGLQFLANVVEEWSDRRVPGCRQ